MVMNKGAALLALGIAGLSYLYRNRKQVQNSLGQMTKRRQEFGQGNQQQAAGSSNQAHSSGDWSTQTNRM